MYLFELQVLSGCVGDTYFSKKYFATQETRGSQSTLKWSVWISATAVY